MECISWSQVGQWVAWVLLVVTGAAMTFYCGYAFGKDA